MNKILLYFKICTLWYIFASAERDHPHSRDNTGNQIKSSTEQQTKYWQKVAQSILAGKLAHKDVSSKQKAKNIVLFLGDGMSMHTVTAARNLYGDSSEKLYFEKFSYVGLSKTYCVDRQVADSACSATAYLGGVKGNYGTIGVNAQVPRSDCKKGAEEKHFVSSIARWAQEAGKVAGFVTTARVTHASPAGVYAHSADRNWENDAEILKSGCSASLNVDIARQLVEWPVGKDLRVILGGGRANFIGKKQRDEEGQPGARLDGRNLIEEWLSDKNLNNKRAQYVWNKKGLNQVKLNETDYILGLFSSSHCPYNGDIERNYLQNADPTLSEMSAAAVKLLQRHKNGYFLFIEGARIDMAHHSTKAIKSLEDTLEFTKAVQLVREMTNEEDTLIVVTSDHSHTMTINGYPNRNQDILGLADENADDGLPYTILSYANGPGYYNTYSKSEGRQKLNTKETHVADFAYPALVPLSSETHGGEDVGIFASGPYAQYFSGNYEQTNVPAMMAKASNIGPYANL